MVQKWAIGAAINMSGSIAINLGTNLMKLSHKIEKGEVQLKPDSSTSGGGKVFRSVTKKNSTVACSADFEASECMIDHSKADDAFRPDSPSRRLGHQQSRAFPSSRASSKNDPCFGGVEMTNYPSEAFTGEPERGGGTGKASTAGSHDPAGAEVAGAGAGAVGRNGDGCKVLGRRGGRAGQITARRASSGSIWDLLGFRGRDGRGRGGGGGGGGAMLKGVDGYEDEEMVGLTREGSWTDSPSSATGEIMGPGLGSEDQAAMGKLLGGGERRSFSQEAQYGGGRKQLATPGVSPASRNASHLDGIHPAGGAPEGAGEGDEFDERVCHEDMNKSKNNHHSTRSVRRRALSSPRQASPTSGEGLSSISGTALGDGLDSGGNGGGVATAGVNAGAWEQQPQRPQHRRAEWKTKALWYLGAFLLVTGSLVNFASFGFAPQSLLASLGSVQFISNVVFGKVILREIVTRRIIVGTATIILGNTLTLCFSPSQSDNFSTAQLKAFYDFEYNTILCLELAFAVAMHVTYMSFRRSKEEGKPKRYSDLAMPLAYAMCSAIVGTQSVVNAKCLSELFTLTYAGENQMGSVFTYLVMAIWLSTTVFWLVRMNRALAMFHGLFIIPALQVFWTFFSVVGGGFYFEEFHTLHAWGGMGFALGVVVVFCGVYLLAPRTQIDHGRREDERAESDGDLPDRTRKLRLDGDSPAVTRMYANAKPCCSREASCQDRAMEAGDEEIDWDHTRMLSLGFFPSISTDEDVAKMGMGKLGSRFDGADPEMGGGGLGNVPVIVGSGADPRAVGQSNSIALLPPVWSKPKNTPPRPLSPMKKRNGSDRTIASPFRAGRSSSSAADEDRRGGVNTLNGTTVGSGSVSGSPQHGCREELERRRRRAGGAGAATAAVAAAVAGAAVVGADITEATSASNRRWGGGGGGGRGAGGRGRARAGAGAGTGPSTTSSSRLAPR